MNVTVISEFATDGRGPGPGPECLILLYSSLRRKYPSRKGGVIHEPVEAGSLIGGDALTPFSPFSSSQQIIVLWVILDVTGYGFWNLNYVCHPYMVSGAKGIDRIVSFNRVSKSKGVWVLQVPWLLFC